MLAASLVRATYCARAQVSTQLKRHICASSILAQKATQQNQDLIQQLFVTKIREYAQKTKAAGGKMPDADPIAEKTLQDELRKLGVQFNVKEGKEAEFAQFPTFKFEENKLNSLPVDEKELDSLLKVEIEKEVIEEEEEEEDECYLDDFIVVKE